MSLALRKGRCLPQNSSRSPRGVLRSEFCVLPSAFCLSIPPSASRWRPFAARKPPPPPQRAHYARRGPRSAADQIAPPHAALTLRASSLTARPTLDRFRWLGFRSDAHRAVGDLSAALNPAAPEAFRGERPPSLAQRGCGSPPFCVLRSAFCVLRSAQKVGLKAVVATTCGGHFHATG